MFYYNDKLMGDIDLPIGVDLGEVGSPGPPASTYPVEESERIGVDTDNAADPESMDQGDEQSDTVMWGTPDDLARDDVYPPPLKTDEDEAQRLV